MDLYRPAIDEPVPVVLWLHSGGWRSGSKDHCFVRWLVRYGYAVATINYRLLPKFKYPAALFDAKAAVRYLRGQAGELGLLPYAIAASGASTGGYLANMLGVTDGLDYFDRVVGEDRDAVDDEHLHVSSHVNAVVNYFGFTDFVAMQSLPSRRHNNALTTPEARFLGVVPRQDFDLTASASPMYHVHAGAPPFLHFHGDQDEVVPLDQSRKFHDALLAKGVNSKLVVAKRVRHHDHTLFNEDSARGKVVDFLDHYMAGDIAATKCRDAGGRPAVRPKRPAPSKPPFKLRITG